MTDEMVEKTPNVRSRLGGLVARFGLRRPDGFELDVELAIEPGTTVALLGPNGSGKSTTVAALAGLLAIDRGSITLSGRVLDDPARGIHLAPAERSLGVVFQRYLLFDHLNVLDNVAFGPSTQALSRRQARTVAQRWLATFDLVELADRTPDQLSGGQAQRVALARALACEPDLLLLDEPLAAVDVATRARLRRSLATHLASYPGPRLLITHDPADAFLLADRILVLEAGRITQQGSRDDIQRRPATPYVAALAGLNLLTGTASRGTLTLPGCPLSLISADTTAGGEVLITIPPNAIALHQQRPSGSPRNTWSTAIESIEAFGDITRVMLADPVPLSVDITPGAASALGLVVGSTVWASVKATEISLNPA